ncbi:MULTISPECIES: ABC transporter substrate-binding protein [Streptomyces]|nr:MULTISPECIES: extracellular solute-binding protein [Streptomyces]
MGAVALRRPRRFTRRGRTLGVAVALTTVLAACGGGGQGSDDPNQLEMWTFKQSHVAGLEVAAEMFEEETGISVRVQAFTPDDAYNTKVAASARTNDLPDVLEVHANGSDFSFGGAGLLEDLSDEVTDEWTAPFLPTVAQEGTVTRQYYEQSLAPGAATVGIEEGQRYSVPFTVGTFGIVYANKERLARAGYTEPPATWEEFIEMLDAVGREFPENGGVTIGMKVPSTGLEWMLQPMAYGQLGPDAYPELFSEDESANWASPAGVTALETFGQITPYWTPGTGIMAIDEADLSFANGESSFVVGGTFTLAFLAENGFDPDNILTFPIPPPANGAMERTDLKPFALTGLSVVREGGNQEAALEWVRFLARDDVARGFAQRALDLPPNDLGENPEEAVGPLLGSMAASLGESEDAYHAGDTSYKPNGYDGADVGAVLAEFTPLERADAEGTGRALAQLINSYWAESRR